MDIISYLVELLQTSKKVGVAGLGTFYKKKTPGRYDANQHSFIPPSFSISFTTNLEDGDELIEHISSQRNITPDSASYFIQEFAERIHGQLSDHREVHLEGLGKLVVQDEQINLIPLEQSNFGHQFYGLPAQPDIKAPDTSEQLGDIEAENKLEEENPGQETVEPSSYVLENGDQPVFEETAETNHIAHQTAIEIPVIETVEREEISQDEDVSETEEVVYEEGEPKKGMGFWGKFFIVLALIVAIGAIAYFINPAFFDKYIQQNFEGKPVIAQPAISQATTKQLDTGKADSLTTNQATSTLNDSTVIDTAKTYYEVIGTSENSKLAAEKYITRVAKRGITAKHIQLSKLRFSVSLGTFSEPKPAEKFADSMRTMLKNKGIYVKPIKPKKHTK